MFALIEIIVMIAEQPKLALILIALTGAGITVYHCSKDDPPPPPKVEKVKPKEHPIRNWIHKVTEPK